MKKETRRKDENGCIPGRIESRPEAHESLSPSEGQSKDLKKRWQTPKNALELARQANQVATMILNEEIDLEIATKYVTAARTSSQLLSIEVYRARLTKKQADISLE